MGDASPGTAPSDDELVAAFVATGSNPAFHELVRRHHASTRSFLRRLCRDPALADDMAQDTFVKALTRLHTYEGNNRFRSWLGGIAYREFLMTVRSTKRLRRLHADAAPLLSTDGVSTGPSPGDRLDLDRALDVLPETERTAIVLNHACGMSHAEIARAMQLPLGTVKTYIDRARKALHKALLGTART